MMVADKRSTQLSRENPWPGLAFFGEGDRAFFHGRDAEAAELLMRVRSEPLTVLFGRSGLGKTSLLNAGLFPLLREEDLLPVYIRLDYGSARPAREQVLDALVSACAAHEIEAPTLHPDETLWAFFHRADAEFWSARNCPVTPVLVFDQFEEMFTVGQGDAAARERSRAFAEELGELIENRVPASVKFALEHDAALGRRDKAMQMLKSRLYEIELEKQRAERDKLEAQKMKNEWGSQIRSYVLDDRRVKDHRTGFETRNTDAVLDGGLDGFLKAFLMWDGN